MSPTAIEETEMRSTDDARATRQPAPIRPTRSAWRAALACWAVWIVAVGAAGCADSDGTSSGADAGSDVLAPDDGLSGSDGAIGSDTTMSDAADSGGPGAGDGGDVDAATPEVPRRLIEVPLMEGTPTNNRVLNPHFDLGAAATWMFLPPQGAVPGAAPVQVHKRALPVAPCSQSVVELPGSDTNPTGAAAFGHVKMGSASVEASVWIGHDPGDMLEPGDVLATVYALALEGLPELAAFDLAPDPSSAIELGGLTWLRHAVVIGEPTLGFGLFRIANAGPSTLMVDCPTVVDEATAGPLSSPSPPLPPRSMGAGERRGVDQARRRATRIGGTPPETLIGSQGPLPPVRAPQRVPKR